jgi:hypothetical protein
MNLRGCNLQGYEFIQHLMKFGFDSTHRLRSFYHTSRQVEEENMIKME